MDSEMREAIKERARDDCIKYGAPNLGVDHSNHYVKIEVLMGIEDDKEKANDTIT